MMVQSGVFQVRMFVIPGLSLGTLGDERQNPANLD